MGGEMPAGYDGPEASFPVGELLDAAFLRGNGLLSLKELEAGQ